MEQYTLRTLRSHVISYDDWDQFCFKQTKEGKDNPETLGPDDQVLLSDEMLVHFDFSARQALPPRTGVSVDIDSYNWSQHRFRLVLSEADFQDDVKATIYEHCISHLDKELNDSQKNRDILHALLKSHNVTDIQFLQSTPKRRKR